MKTIHFTCYLALTVLVFAFGCASKGKQDPLPASQGWKQLMAREYQKLDPAITTDYQAYLQRLPLTERSQVLDSSIHYFGNTNGQHAVSFEIGREAFIGLSEIIYNHVLIYDQSNRRIKEIKYRSRKRLLL
jgi:hypothetical protein